MRPTTIQMGHSASNTLLEGVAATLRRLEREAAGHPESPAFGDGASRRLATFQRTLAKALQAAHLETVQELTVG
jgi:hypothetical protein